MLHIAHYLPRKHRFEMSLAAFLSFYCHLLVEEMKSLTKRKVRFEKAPNIGVHLLLLETKTEANNGVNVRFKTVKLLLERR